MELGLYSQGTSLVPFAWADIVVKVVAWKKGER